jgi:Fatty acid desaturase
LSGPSFLHTLTDGETGGECYLCQMIGSANMRGRVMHLMTGNPSHQIEHHLFADMPSNRYHEIAPRIPGDQRPLRLEPHHADPSPAGGLGMEARDPALPPERHDLPRRDSAYRRLARSATNTITVRLSRSPGAQRRALRVRRRLLTGSARDTELVGGRTGDPRALALADYLRSQAAALSLSADSTGEQHIARAGMALLDAAALAEHLPATDRRLLALSLAERFETMPDGTSQFLETQDVRAALRRPISGASMTGEQILDLLAAIARDG